MTRIIKKYSVMTALTMTVLIGCIIVFSFIYSASFGNFISTIHYRVSSFIVNEIDGPEISLAGAAKVQVAQNAFAGDSNRTASFLVIVNGLDIISKSATLARPKVGDPLVISETIQSPRQDVSGFFVCQIIDENRVTESIRFSRIGINGNSSSNSTSIQQALTFEKAGKCVVECFLLSQDLFHPYALANKKVMEVDVEPRTTLVTIPYGASSGKNVEPGTVRVVVGFNNTVVWLNKDIIAHGIASDDTYGLDGGRDDNGSAIMDKANLALASSNGIGAIRIIEPTKSYAFTFTRPGIYGYHGVPHPWLRGSVIVIQNPYLPRDNSKEDLNNAYAKMSMSVYGSYNTRTLAGHFLKGYLYSDSGKPIINGSIAVSVNNVFMGKTSSAADGCLILWLGTILKCNLTLS